MRLPRRTPEKLRGIRELSRYGGAVSRATGYSMRCMRPSCSQSAAFAPRGKTKFALGLAWRQAFPRRRPCERNKVSISLISQLSLEKRSKSDRIRRLRSYGAVRERSIIPTTGSNIRTIGSTTRRIAFAGTGRSTRPSYALLGDVQGRKRCSRTRMTGQAMYVACTFRHGRSGIHVGSSESARQPVQTRDQLRRSRDCLL